MKVASRQIGMAIERMRNELGAINSKTDLTIEFTMTQEDPGSGVMVDCITISASTNPSESDAEAKIKSMTVEIYPESEKLEPRATKTETFKVTKTY